MTWLLVFLPGLLAGLVQGLTGFGAAIVMMIFLPQLFSIAQSAAVAGVIMAASVLILVWRNRHHIHLRQIVIPFIVYASVFSASQSRIRCATITPVTRGLISGVGDLLQSKQTRGHPSLSMVASRNLYDYFRLFQWLVWHWRPLNGTVFSFVGGYNG